MAPPVAAVLVCNRGWVGTVIRLTKGRLEEYWMSSWTELLTHAEPGDHVVQLYGEDDQLLAKNVSRYLAEGLRRLDGLVVIATPEHSQAIARHLDRGERRGHARGGARGAARLPRRAHDARSHPGGRAAGRGALRLRRRRGFAGGAGAVGHGKVRAFGEMVGLLWSEERYAEAELLEELWNAALAGSAYSLYCAYRIDLFGEKVDLAGLSSIVARPHSSLRRTPDHALERPRLRLRPPSPRRSLRVVEVLHRSPHWRLSCSLALCPASVSPPRRSRSPPAGATSPRVTPPRPPPLRPAPSRRMPPEARMS